MPPKFFYFDLGHVLLSFSHERMCEQMAHVAGVPMTVVRDLIFGREDARAAEWEYECGLMSTEEFFDFFCHATGTNPNRRELELAASDIFSPIEETWELVERMAAAGHRMGLLSNTNPVQWNFIRGGRFPLLANVGASDGLFEWAVLSFEVRSMKPDRKIYDDAVRRTGVAANEVFFVDDRAENVAGAIAAGMDAVLMIGIDQLVDDLEARGIV